MSTPSQLRGATSVCSALVLLWLGAAVPVRAAAADEALAEPTVEADGPPAEEAVDEEAAAELAVESLRLFEQLLVVGGPEQERRIPGSAHLITVRDVERQQYSDVHRVLRQTPGVNIQEEDGYGLRPNIGIRGTGVERSQKITLLEDGVLIAPAPYAAPSAYYSPTAGRMEGFEIRKGSGAIRQGPYTNGGAINYRSTSIPGSLGGRLSVAGGDDRLRRARAWIGDSSQRFGWLVETYRLETDGFKRLDGGGPTGFELTDHLAKLRINSRPEAEVFQALELKLGRTEQLGQETYLGLAAADFARDPYRRYAASAGDSISTDHEQVQLSYYLRPGDRFELTATAYRNDFFRNWFKLESVAGTKVSEVFSPGGGSPELLAILRGEADSEPGALGVRNNRRDYYSEGVQLVAGWDATWGGVTHDLEAGLRVHRDAEDRFQEEDLFQMLAGRRVLSAAGAPGSQANRVARAEATAFFVQDTFSTGRWTWTPGLRIESIDLDRRDYGRSDPERTGSDLRLRSNDLTEVIPGLGLGFQVSDASSLFLGVHRGFSPPGPGSTAEVEAETSVNYELGWRFGRGDVTAELVGFYNDYDNLLGSDTVSAGGDGTGDQFNGGEVEVVGLEAGLGVDLARGSRGRLRLPLRVAYTYTGAKFGSSFETDFADWAPRVERGDEVPYIPEHQLYAGLSASAGRWSLHLDGTYGTEMRTRAGRGPILESESIESRMLIDLRGEVELGARTRLWAQMLNATDRVYVAARRPAGLRPGRPRALLLGVSVDLGGGSR